LCSGRIVFRQFRRVFRPISIKRQDGVDFRRGQKGMDVLEMDNPYYLMASNESLSEEDAWERAFRGATSIYHL
jgi:hypothetical protein